MRIKSSLISLFTYVMLPTLFVCTSCKRGGGNTSSSREMQVTKTAKDHSENVVKSLTTEQFTNIIADINNDGQWKYKGNRPAVIDFYATWCQPCRMMAPELEAVAKEYQGKVDFFRVDIDDEQRLADYFDINSIPTLLYIPLTGSPILEVGGRDREHIKKTVETKLLK